MNNNNNKIIAAYLKEQIQHKENEAAKKILDLNKSNKDIDFQEQLSGIPYLVYRDTHKAEESILYQSSKRNKLSLSIKITLLKMEIESLLNDAVNLKNIHTWYEDDTEFDE